MGPKQDPSSSTANGAARKETTKAAVAVQYRECQRNHAAAIGGYAVDGCREFMALGADTLACAACGCHRSFHRRDEAVDDDDQADDGDCSSTTTSG